MTMRMTPSTRLKTKGLAKVSSNCFTTTSGTTTNRPTAIATATMTVTAICFHPNAGGCSSTSTTVEVAGTSSPAASLAGSAVASAVTAAGRDGLRGSGLSATVGGIGRASAASSSRGPPG